MENIHNTPSTLPTVTSWDAMNLKEPLLRGIYAYGFEIPSDIQKQAIIPIIQGKDIIAQAQSGTGKTGSFSISILERIDITQSCTQALILSPTHELVKQTAGVISDIGRNMDGLKVKTLVGGTPVREDVVALKYHTPHIVVGTVGRVLDMFQKRHLRGDALKMLIMDEADEMLSQGFSEKIRWLFQNYFTESMQVVLFSATMPREILYLSERFMNAPEKLLMKKEELSLKCIQQYFVAVLHDQMKYDRLKELFSVLSVSKSIIYCNSVKRVMDLYDWMTKEGFSVCYIHSNMDKNERKHALHTFRTSDIRVMISSDITARGIDVQQVSMVINFDLTRNIHTYLHRIGRGGRWGRKGMAINFITKQDIQDMKRIENYYKIDIMELPSDQSQWSLT